MSRKRATTLDADKPLGLQFGSLHDPQAMTLDEEVKQTRQRWEALHVQHGAKAPPVKEEEGRTMDIDEAFERAGAQLAVPLEYMDGFVKYIFYHRFYDIQIDQLAQDELADYQRAQNAYSSFKLFLAKQASKIQMDIHELAIESKNKSLIAVLAYLGECPHVIAAVGGAQGRTDLWTLESSRVGNWTTSLKSTDWCVSVSSDKLHASFFACIHCFYHMEYYVQLALDKLVKHQSNARDTWEYFMGTDAHVSAPGWSNQKIDLLLRLRAVVEIIQTWG